MKISRSSGQASTVRFGNLPKVDIKAIFLISNLKKKRLASKDRNSKKGATDYYQAGSLFRASG